MATDTRHAFKANGYFRLPLAFEVASAYRYVSGYAWSLERNALPYGREYREGRGTRRLPHFSQLDLDLSKTFAIGGTELRVIASVLNVFDQEAVTAVNPLEDGGRRADRLPAAPEVRGGAPLLGLRGRLRLHCSPES